MMETQQVINYGVTEKAIAELRDKFSYLIDVPLSDKVGRKQLNAAITELTGLRTAVESKRKEMKAEALEYGRRLDAEAKRVTELIDTVEAPLRKHKTTLAEEEARIEAEAAKKEQDRKNAILERIAAIRGYPMKLQALNSEQSAEVLAEMLDLSIPDIVFQEYTEEAASALDAAIIQVRSIIANKVEQEAAAREEAERKRKEDEERAERDRLQREEQARLDEQARIQREQAERLAEQQRKIDAENAEIERRARELREQEEAAQREVERKRIYQEAQERAEREAKERQEREAEERKRAEAAERERLERLEAQRPAIDRITDILSETIDRLQKLDLTEQDPRVLDIRLHAVESAAQVIEEIQHWGHDAIFTR